MIDCESEDILQFFNQDFFSINLFAGKQMLEWYENDEVYYKGIPVTGYTFVLINKTTGAAITSGSVTAKITQDGGSQASVSASASHEGNGQWSINLSAAEMTADVVALAFIHSSAVPVYVTIHTK